MSNELQRVDASLTLDAGYLQSTVAHGFALAYDSTELWRGKPEDLAALIRDGKRFRKLKHAHESLGGKLVRWCVMDSRTGRFLPADAMLDQIADAMPEVET